MKAVRVLNVIQCTNLGGMEQASLRLMVGLQRRGHHFDVLSLNPVGDLKPLLAKFGIVSTSLGYEGRWGWRSLVRFMTWLPRAESKVDAVLMTGHNFAAVLALRRDRAKPRVLAIHFHHTGVKPAWFWKLFYALARRRFTAITFPCEFIRAEAEKLSPQIAPLSHVIRYPLDRPRTDTARAEARRQLSIPDHFKVIGSAGWLIPRKRGDVFLRAAWEITQDVSDVLFLIAGDGPERQTLAQLADELGIASKVRWLGWQHDLHLFYTSLDVLLFNTDWDALPVTPQEAMAYGVPVVASAVHSGLKELIDSPEVGLLNDCHDVAWLAENVVHLLRNPELAAEMGNAARERIRVVGDTDRIAEQYEALFATT